MISERPARGFEPVYGVSLAFIRWAFGTLFRGDVAGREHLPLWGGYIVASNHVSHLDPPIVGLHLTQQVSFFARKTLWKPGFASWWLNAVGTIPVDRDGASDVGAMKRILQTLRAGKTIILFPEGTRSVDGRLQLPKPGVGMIACKTRSTVIPARIFGSYEAFGKGGRLRLGVPVRVSYGPPLRPQDYDHPADGPDRYQRAAERIMAAVARLEPPLERVI